MEIHAIRKDYTKFDFDIANAHQNAVEQFKSWFAEALDAKVNEPNAMVLATVDAKNKPHARIVLVKDITETGFSFFTNYESNKGIEIASNNFGSLVFFWPELERQVRVEGTISKVSRSESEKYFHSRPRASQIGAHVSPQSKVIPNREFLTEREQKFTQSFENKEVALPDDWGGYCLKPSSIEFWQGRPSRLHDRLLYTLKNGNWLVERLAP